MNSESRSLTSAHRFVVRGLRYLSHSFLLAGVAAFGYAGYILADAGIYQAVELRKFSHDAPLVEPHLLTIGEIVGQIEIPSLALRAVIVQGDSSELLRRAVGHLAETPMPGEWGNVALAGHRDSFFRGLRHIHPGDAITLRTFRGETFHYRVESTSVVSATDIEVLQPANGRALTLITCFPFDYIGPAPNRFIVRAVQVERTKEVNSSSSGCERAQPPLGRGPRGDCSKLSGHSGGAWSAIRSHITLPLVMAVVEDQRY